MDFVSVELAGLFYGRIQTKVGIKLLWGGKQVEGAHFSDQDNHTEEASAAQGLEDENTVIRPASLPVFQQPYAVL